MTTTLDTAFLTINSLELATVNGGADIDINRAVDSGNRWAQAAGAVGAGVGMVAGAPGGPAGMATGAGIGGAIGLAGGFIGGAAGDIYNQTQGR